MGAAIIFHQGNVLISQRDDDAHLSRCWEFPGGKREGNESFEDCIRREILEELNVEVEVRNLFDTVEHEYDEKIVLLKFFSCQYLRGQAKALGCRQFQWVSLSQLPSFTFPAANEPIIRKLLQTL